jgi:hypothetical protein
MGGNQLQRSDVKELSEKSDSTQVPLVGGAGLQGTQEGASARGTALAAACMRPCAAAANSALAMVGD